MSDETVPKKKPRKRRKAKEQAQDIVAALRRARTTYILEDNEEMAEVMHSMCKALTAKLNMLPPAPDTTP